jgi:tetratricopeptide (TPR) repeat protein
VGYQDVGKITEARQMLVDNLYNFSLTPDSSDWRDSLFALGKLVYGEALSREAKSRELGVDNPSSEIRKGGLKELEAANQLFQESSQLLEEAVERYPTAPQAVEARYLLAESHRQAAKWPRKRLDSTAIEASKGGLTREMQEELAAAFKEYTLLIEQLGDESDGTGADSLDQAILRNSYFGRADVLFDQGKFEDALAAYSAATNRYQHEPVALEAYVQIAACYRRLGRAAEARGTLEQARVVFSRMNADVNFTKATPYTREEWNRLLMRLSNM